MVQFSITGPDLDPEIIEKFDGRFGRQILHLKKAQKIIIFEPFLNIQKPSLFYFLFYTIINTRLIIIIKIFFFNYKTINSFKKNISLIGSRALNQTLKKVKKLSPVLTPSHLGSSPGLIGKTLR